MNELASIGGEEALREVIGDFVDRVFSDMMIGYLFRNADPDRVKKHEFEHAAIFLGADVEYTGRPLNEAHRVHRIQGGEFDRRLVILRDTLLDHAVPPAVIDRWIAHQESLRATITDQASGECR